MSVRVRGVSGDRVSGGSSGRSEIGSHFLLCKVARSTEDCTAEDASISREGAARGNAPMMTVLSLRASPWEASMEGMVPDIER